MRSWVRRSSARCQNPASLWSADRYFIAIRRYAVSPAGGVAKELERAPPTIYAYCHCATLRNEAVVSGVEYQSPDQQRWITSSCFLDAHELAG